MTTIKLKNPYFAKEVSRNFRPFISRYGRIVDLPSKGMVMINDTGKNTHRLLKLIENVDTKPTPTEIKELEKKEKSRHKIKYIKAKNCSDIKEDLEEIKAFLYKK